MVIVKPPWYGPFSGDTVTDEMVAFEPSAMALRFQMGKKKERVCKRERKREGEREGERERERERLEVGGEVVVVRPQIRAHTQPTHTHTSTPLPSHTHIHTYSITYARAYQNSTYHWCSSWQP
jgi:hypothetical protein